MAAYSLDYVGPIFSRPKEPFQGADRIAEDVGGPKFEMRRTRVCNGSDYSSTHSFEFDKDTEGGKMNNDFGSANDIYRAILEGQTRSISRDNRIAFIANHLTKKS